MSTSASIKTINTFKRLRKAKEKREDRELHERCARKQAEEEREETTLVVRIGNNSLTVTTKNGRLDIQVFNHDPS
jgi:hypothetical protein